jgi:hypothetical protein
MMLLVLDSTTNTDYLTVHVALNVERLHLSPTFDTLEALVTEVRTAAERPPQTPLKHRQWFAPTRLSHAAMNIAPKPRRRTHFQPGKDPSGAPIHTYSEPEIRITPLATDQEEPCEDARRGRSHRHTDSWSFISKWTNKMEMVAQLLIAPVIVAPSCEGACGDPNQAPHLSMRRHHFGNKITPPEPS